MTPADRRKLAEAVAERLGIEVQPDLLGRGFSRYIVSDGLFLLTWGSWDDAWALRERKPGAVGFVEHRYRHRGRGWAGKTADAIAEAVRARP